MANDLDDARDLLDRYDKLDAGRRMDAGGQAILEEVRVRAMMSIATSLDYLAASQFTRDSAR